MSRWFRFHAATLNSRKVQRLAPDLFKAWVNLLCVACEGDGALPALDEIAFALRTTEEKAGRIIAALVEAGLIDDSGNSLRPHDWNEWQYQSDRSTERVKRHRERQMKRSETVSETPSDTETDTETESDTETEAAPSRGDVSSTSEFAEFWAIYPNHVAKRAALKAFTKARQRAEHSEILAGAARYAHDPTRKPEFTAHPATWLNADRWLDEPVKSGVEAIIERMNGENHDEYR